MSDSPNWVERPGLTAEDRGREETAYRAPFLRRCAVRRRCGGTRAAGCPVVHNAKVTAHPPKSQSRVAATRIVESVVAFSVSPVAPVASTSGTKIAPLEISIGVVR